VGWRLTHGLRLAIKALLVVAGVVAVAPVVLVGLGYQPTLLRTQAMQPAMAEGDIVVNESSLPSGIVAGDVITFSDADREGETFTERVIAVAPSSEGYAFATRSDSSATAHQWSIPEQQRVTRVAFHLPATSPPMALVTTLAGRPALLAGVLAALLAMVVLRRLAR
jgi:hypothetical protein